MDPLLRKLFERFVHLSPAVPGREAVSHVIPVPDTHAQNIDDQRIGLEEATRAHLVENAPSGVLEDVDFVFPDVPAHVAILRHAAACFPLLPDSLRPEASFGSSGAAGKAKV